jgi:type IV pilus assembly protein PilQ
VGDPKVVAVAENYLKQLDLRQRQVALAVKILDVDLSNDTELANSFAFRWGNNFIVNDNGELVGAFGRNLPPGVDDFSGLSSSELVNQQRSLTESISGSISDAGREFSRSANLDSNTDSTYLGRRRRNPGTLYDRDNFVDFVRATIESRTTKVLASPTLILQENPSLIRGQDTGGSGGSSEDSTFDRSFSDIDAPIGRRRANEGVVRVGTNVPTSVSSTIVGDAGSVTCEIDELTTAGLVLGARVEKIDDNGFVTFSLSPSISAVEREVPSGNDCPPISILRVRRLDTGAVRVRDGQTLILTGVISDADLAELRKWPILGDIPLIGQFFRQSSNAREKRELVILVTPRIIDDNEGGAYGYGYTPSSSQSRQFMRSVGN